MKKSQAVLGLLLLAGLLLGAAAAPLLTVTVADPLTGNRTLSFSVGNVVALAVPTALVFGAGALALSLVRRTGRLVVAGAVTGLSLLLGWRLGQAVTNLAEAADEAVRTQEVLTGTVQEVTGPHWGAALAGVVLLLALGLSYSVVRSRQSWGGASSGKYETNSVSKKGDVANQNPAHTPDLWADWDAISRGDDPSDK